MRDVDFIERASFQLTAQSRGWTVDWIDLDRGELLLSRYGKKASTPMSISEAYKHITSRL